ncbi:hypothetical protein BWP39_02125 [Paraburkholderia acidicola]|uniref:Type VI secretion protein n=1 Tax=Paraburkholderia acidicola TaxID=1912599 RepID=A0A2A4F2J9_9BURK|nr:hypothetical protein [Paraburkholderia acidicola]PCE27315.1 hypothetical protein BWP39_02125 [Paraburkholderia acidicola]
MSWPVPTLTTIERPPPVSVRVWLSLLVAAAATTAAAVLMLWPHGQSTGTVIFWVLLVGAPLCTCTLLFGWRLSRWEQEQLNAEESEQEKERVESLWRDWCRRALSVDCAAGFLPQAVGADRLGDRDAMLPVNMNRAVGFEWAKDKTGAQRRSELLHRVASRLAHRLTDFRAIALTLILDGVSLADEEAWEAEATRIFSEAAPGVDFHVDFAMETDCVEWIGPHIDADELPPRLVIAAQLWHGEGDHAFSEGAAAILFGSRTGSGRTETPAAPAAGYILRPMTTGDELLKADLSQLMEMQVMPRRLTHVWFTGCSDAFEVATSASLSSPETTIVDVLLDSVAGVAGPVSGWIALSLALEAGQSNPNPQLVVGRQPGRDETRLCVVTSGEFEEN